MRSLLPSALLAALAMALLPAMPQPAHAAVGVQRCALPDGSNVYTSEACSTIGATSTPLPRDLVSRIEQELRREAALTGTQSSIASTTTSNLPATTARRSLRGGCADSPWQLAMDLQSAVASGDVNRVAESYHWTGMGNAAAQRIMLRLEQLASRKMVSIEYFDANIGGLGSGFADAGTGVAVGNSGMIRAQVRAGMGHQLVDFSVQRHAGCYFVRY